MRVGFINNQDDKYFGEYLDDPNVDNEEILDDLLFQNLVADGLEELPLDFLNLGEPISKQENLGLAPFDGIEVEDDVVQLVVVDLDGPLHQEDKGLGLVDDEDKADGDDEEGREGSGDKDEAQAGHEEKGHENKGIQQAGRGLRFYFEKGVGHDGNDLAGGGPFREVANVAVEQLVQQRCEHLLGQFPEYFKNQKGSPEIEKELGDDQQKNHPYKKFVGVGFILDHAGH